MMAKQPISNKVAAGTLTGTAVTVLTWALTTYIPAWHSGIPSTLAALLPGLVGAVGYFAGGYMAKHYPAALSEVPRLSDLFGQKPDPEFLRQLREAIQKYEQPRQPQRSGAVHVTKTPPS